jgi:hypothetical protein
MGLEFNKNAELPFLYSMISLFCWSTIVVNCVLSYIPHFNNCLGDTPTPLMQYGYLHTY